ILSEDQRELSDHFASQLADKFTGMEYSTGDHGLPILNHVAASLECRVEREYDGGDHTIFLGAVEAVKVNDVRSLAYLHGDYRAIPH
ncbi:MAG: flavin reductase family protein, partial [Acidobacteriota bacterium]